MYSGNCDYFDFFMCMNEHYGTEYMGEMSTKSNLTQGGCGHITGKAQR